MRRRPAARREVAGSVIMNQKEVREMRTGMKIGAALLVVVTLENRCPAVETPLGTSFSYQG